MENASIAIIGGTGQLGRGLAFRLARAGDGKVIIGSRDREKAKTAVASLKEIVENADVHGSSNLDAAREADIAIIAVPYSSHAETLRSLKDALQMKVVMDAVVPLRRGKPFVPEAGSALLEARQILGGDVYLAGTFHHVPAPELLRPESQLGDILVCGDHDSAKEKAGEIIRRLGGRALDAGPAAHAYILEGLTGLLLYLNRKYKSNHAGVRITGVRA